MLNTVTPSARFMAQRKGLLAVAAWLEHQRQRRAHHPHAVEDVLSVVSHHNLRQAFLPRFEYYRQAEWRAACARAPPIIRKANVCRNSAHGYLGSISYVGTWKHGKANA